MPEITMPMGRYLREKPTLKYLFFGGKGGVGKTVFAAAAAIGLARRTPDAARVHQSRA